MFFITDAELGFYDGNGKLIIEPGEFEIMVGTNSQKGIAGSFIKK